MSASVTEVAGAQIRGIRWPAWILGGVVAVAAVASAVAGVRYLAAHVSTDDAFVEVPTVYVSSQVPGRVLELLVEENQRVDKGDVLVRLDAEKFELQLARAEAGLALARNRVVQAEATSAATDAERGAATVELARARRDLERAQSLRADGTVSQANLDHAQSAFDSRKAHVRALELRAEAEQALIKDDAQVRLAEAERRAAALDVERTRIRAPFAGIVGRRNAEPGAVVAPGQPLLALVSSEEVWVMANFKETQIEKLRIGDLAEVTIDAFPDAVWRGRVDSFSPATGAEYALIAPEPAAGNFTKVVQRVPVKIVLSQHPARGVLARTGPILAAGLSAQVDIQVD